ncbi:MAG: hypothetical protein HC921_21020 [Synechococcaceae cyanobacterium SM2_3_1]|nr:hypothetical protein [Synechococcaceae cyanobacterium SM2_3_1]
MNITQSQTQLKSQFLLAQKDLIKKVESNHLQPIDRFELLLSVLLNISEGVIAFILLAPAGLPLALGSAIFPIMISIALAKVQSDQFDYPAACENLITRYETFLPPSQMTSGEALTICQLNDSIKFIGKRSNTNGIRNLEEARASATIKFSNNRLNTLRAQCDDDICSLFEEFTKIKEEAVRQYQESLKQLQETYSSQTEELRSQVFSSPYNPPRARYFWYAIR